MKQKSKLLLAFVLMVSLAVSLAACGSSDNAQKEETPVATASTQLFSISMPKDLDGLYTVKIDNANNAVRIYDQESVNAGFGGYVFGIFAFGEPEEYAHMPGNIKVGELTAKDNTVYDIVLSTPTDVQWDYTKDNPEQMPESYQKLYDARLSVVEKLVAADGAAYVYGAGTKGENLYGDILQKHLTAMEENWDANRLEENDMSSMYYAVSAADATVEATDDGYVANTQDVLERIGYTYYDVNGDGIDELLIGEIAEGDWKGVIYDVYTMVDRKPAHVVSGWARNRLYALKDGFSLVNEASGGAAESEWRISDIEPNTAELHPWLIFKYDANENEAQPWFISSSIEDDEWDNVSEEEWNDQKSRFEDYERFDFTPFSSLK